jgi:hypothetical protein
VCTDLSGYVAECICTKPLLSFEKPVAEYPLIQRRIPEERNLQLCRHITALYNLLSKAYPRRRWEDNIKMDLQEVECGGIGSSWLRVGTGGGHLWMR